MQSSTPGFPWLPVIAIIGSLLGGGAMGAVITLLVSRHRGKRQPVGFSIEIIDIFKQNPEIPSLRAMLEFPLPKESGAVAGSLMLANLSVIRVKVKNKGNQDFPEFGMGITLEENETDAFNVKVESIDRHHVGELVTPIAYENPVNELDFVLKPFNRGEAYTINTYVTYEKAVGEIKLSSPHSTTFVELTTSDDKRIKQNFIFVLATNSGALIALSFWGLFRGEWINDWSPEAVFKFAMMIFVTFFIPLFVWKWVRSV